MYRRRQTDTQQQLVLQMIASTWRKTIMLFSCSVSDNNDDKIANLTTMLLRVQFQTIRNDDKIANSSRQNGTMPNHKSQFALVPPWCLHGEKTIMLFSCSVSNNNDDKIANSSRQNGTMPNIIHIYIGPSLVS